MTICGDVLSNVWWGENPRNDCRDTLLSVVGDVCRTQQWHDDQAHRHARVLRQHEERTGSSVFCAPLSAHWIGHSKSAAKRPRASAGVFVDRCVVRERVTVSERVRDNGE